MSKLQLELIGRTTNIFVVHFNTINLLTSEYWLIDILNIFVVFHIMVDTLRNTNDTINNARLKKNIDNYHRSYNLAESFGRGVLLCFGVEEYWVSNRRLIWWYMLFIYNTCLWNKTFTRCINQKISLHACRELTDQFAWIMLPVFYPKSVSTRWK